MSLNFCSNMYLQQQRPTLCFSNQTSTYAILFGNHFLGARNFVKSWTRHWVAINKTWKPETDVGLLTMRSVHTIVGIFTDEWDSFTHICKSWKWGEVCWDASEERMWRQLRPTGYCLTLLLCFQLINTITAGLFCFALSQDGETALHFAARCGHLKTTRLLLDDGALPTNRTNVSQPWRLIHRWSINHRQSANLALHWLTVIYYVLFAV